MMRKYSHLRHRYLDILYRGVTKFSAIIVLCILIAIIVVLFSGAFLAIQKFGLGFLTSSAWNPVTEKFGALVPVFGTLVTSAIAMLIGVPISFGIALFLTELSPPWLRRPLGIAIEMLAAVPSIIFGMWGLFVFAPVFADTVEPWLINNIGPIPIIGMLFHGAPMGIGVLTAGLILGIMVIPFIASIMRDVFNAVPSALRESAYAVGATTWEVVWHVILPYARVGVIGGIMLGLGRALGETMAVTFVIGNAQTINTSLLMPGNSIAAALANEFTEAIGDIYISSLLYVGLLLFAITFVVLAISRIMLMRLEKREGVKI